MAKCAVDGWESPDETELCPVCGTPFLIKFKAPVVQVVMFPKKPKKEKK